MAHLGEEIKKLGFGMMRLPRIDKERDIIDIEQTKKMVDMFLAAGHTYFDTAFVYAGSEDAVKQSLVDRHPRESYQLATKLAAFIRCETRDDAIGQFHTSLERTGAGYFDFYLLHNLGADRTKMYDNFGLWEWARERKAEGTIKHFGFSFHSTADDLDNILTAHPEVEFVQLQINYADWEHGVIQSRKNYEVCRKHGKPVVIMEPVKGGLLATPPDHIAKIFKDADPKASLPSWALKFAADLEGIITVLSGMSTIEQMGENLAVMKDFKHLTDDEHKVIAHAREELAKMPTIPCTSCDYCAKVCPENIAISGSFSAYNNYTIYGNKAAFERSVGIQLNRGKKPAASCVKCGACEAACPQSIAIRAELEKVAKV